MQQMLNWLIAAMFKNYIQNQLLSPDTKKAGFPAAV